MGGVCLISSSSSGPAGMLLQSWGGAATRSPPTMHRRQFVCMQFPGDMHASPQVISNPHNYTGKYTQKIWWPGYYKYKSLGDFLLDRASSCCRHRYILFRLKGLPQYRFMAVPCSLLSPPRTVYAANSPQHPAVGAQITWMVPRWPQ